MAEHSVTAADYAGWAEAQLVAELGLLEWERDEQGVDHAESLEAVYAALDVVRGM